LPRRGAAVAFSCVPPPCDMVLSSCCRSFPPGRAPPARHRKKKESRSMNRSTQLDSMISAALAPAACGPAPLGLGAGPAGGCLSLFKKRGRRAQPRATRTLAVARRTRRRDGVWVSPRPEVSLRTVKRTWQHTATVAASRSGSHASAYIVMAQRRAQRAH
jgi:hypothetical protein